MTKKKKRKSPEGIHRAMPKSQKRRRIKPRRRPCLADAPYDITEGVTQSLLGTFINCRQKCRYVLDGWRSVRTKESLLFGSLVHTLLEDLYNMIMIDGEVDDPVTFLAQRSDVWLRKQRKSGRDTNPQATELCVTQALAILPSYYDFWRRQDLRKNRWLQLEGKFDVNWHGFRLRGMWDGLFRGKGAKNTLWLLESKTRSRVSSDIEAEIAFNFQNLYYVTALTKYVEHDPKLKKCSVAGVVRNIIRRPGLRQGKTETEKQLFDRIKADVREKRPEHYFIRYEAPYPKSVLKRFGDELRVKLMDFKDWLDGELPTYRNESACSAGWNCGFIAACAAGGSPGKAGFVQDGRLFSELEG